MRFSVLALLLGGCAVGASSSEYPRFHRSWPTLEPDGRIGARPIDPYAPQVARKREAKPQRGMIERDGDHVISEVEFGDPGSVVGMTVRIATGAYRVPNTPHHRAVVERDGVQRVTIDRSPGAAVTATERADALRETSEIDARTAEIRAAAREAVRGARTDRARVDALVRYVYTHVTYMLADERTASQVLRNGYGDCSEMSLLFVALARASGVPARRVHGLAATVADGRSAFGFHAWAEVSLDGHWVAVDPTWDEPIADATHVVLGIGDTIEWGEAIEHLQVAVVDVKTDTRLGGRADVRQLAHELPPFMRLRR